MKVNRTYSMDYDLVIQLGKKTNQSQEVCKALRKHLTGQENTTLSEFSTMALLASLQARFAPQSAERHLVQSLIAMHMPSTHS